MALLQWLEGLPFSVWLRGSPSLWAYPCFLFVHTVGLAFAAGPSLVIDLRLLGVGRALPVAPFDRFFGVIWIAFWVSAASGVALLAADATAKLANPLFYVKMTFVFAAVALMVVMRRRVFRGAAAGDAAAPGGPAGLLAAASLVCWLGAIVAGRFMAYF